jgi:hypothetical protein
VFWNPADARIYVRMNAADPRRMPVILFPQSYLMRFTGRAANIRIEGIDLRYQNTALEFQGGAHHITIANCSITAGQYHVIVRDGAHDLTFDGITDIDAFPPWVAWSDVKRWNRPGRRMQAAAFDIGAAYNIEIANSTI